MISYEVPLTARDNDFNNFDFDEDFDFEDLAGFEEEFDFEGLKDFDVC